MNCNKAKKSHLTYWEQLPARQRELEAHLQDCPPCRHSFQQLSSAIQISQQILRPEERPEDFAPYWHRLCRRLVKPTLSQRFSESAKNIVALINRATVGPVPAYAVAAVVLLAVAVLFPLSQTGNSILSTHADFRSDLVPERFEPMWASTKDGMTIYTLAQNTAPNPAPSTASSTTAR